MPAVARWAMAGHPSIPAKDGETGVGRLEAGESEVAAGIGIFWGERGVRRGRRFRLVSREVAKKRNARYTLDLIRETSCCLPLCSLWRFFRNSLVRRSRRRRICAGAGTMEQGAGTEWNRGERGGRESGRKLKVQGDKLKVTKPASRECAIAAESTGN